jgi:hypothetical protein
LAEDAKTSDLYKKYGESIEALKKAIKAAANGKGKWLDAWNKLTEASKRVAALDAQIPELEKAIDKFEKEVQKHVPMNDPNAEELTQVLKAFKLGPVIYKRATEYFIESK